MRRQFANAKDKEKKSDELQEKLNLVKTVFFVESAANIYVIAR